MIELRSGEKPYMPAVAWAYPQSAGGQRQALPATPVIPAVAARNYRYALSGGNPPWKPLAVYDDGRRVYVEFPRGIVQGEMPPIFVIGPEGEAQIANSRIYQHILIVDRLFGAAELRLGAGDRQQTVRIVRTDGRPQS
jgi:type IV secretion system protein VirB9